MGPGTKVALTGVAAYYAGKWVANSDWANKQIAEAKAKDANAGTPITVTLATAGAAAAVGYGGYRFFVHKKEG